MSVRKRLFGVQRSAFSVRSYEFRVQRSNALSTLCCELEQMPPPATPSAECRRTLNANCRPRPSAALALSDFRLFPAELSLDWPDYWHSVLIGLKPRSFSLMAIATHPLWPLWSFRLMRRDRFLTESPGFEQGPYWAAAEKPDMQPGH